MNKYKKVIAVVMVFVFAFAFANYNDVSSVYAASKIISKSGAAAPGTLYVGHKYSLKVAGTKVKFYSTNKKVATVGLNTGIVKAVGPGAVTIMARSAKTGKTVATKRFTVNQRATDIMLNTQEVYLSVGGTFTIETNKVPATSTDIIKYFSDDKNIATVGIYTGKIIAKEKGKTRIRVCSLASKATSSTSKNAIIKYIDVYVGAENISSVTPQLVEIDGKSEYELEVEVSGNKDEFDISKMTVTEKSANAQVSITQKSIEKKSDDKFTVVVATSEGFEAEKTYDIKYNNTMSVEIPKKEAAVVSMDVNPKTVYENQQTELKVSLYDKDKNLIKEATFEELEKDKNFSFMYSKSSSSIDFNNGNVTIPLNKQLSINMKYINGNDKFASSVAEITSIKDPIKEEAKK